MHIFDSCSRCTSKSSSLISFKFTGLPPYPWHRTCRACRSQPTHRAAHAAHTPCGCRSPSPPHSTGNLFQRLENGLARRRVRVAGDRRQQRLLLVAQRPRARHQARTAMDTPQRVSKPCWLCLWPVCGDGAVLAWRGRAHAATDSGAGAAASAAGAGATTSDTPAARRMASASLPSASHAMRSVNARTLLPAMW